MAQQVKFYSVNALPSTASTTGVGGIYFVDGGELYKGTSRFGANKVWTVPSTGQDAEGYDLASALTAAGVTGAIGGDILTGYGAAKVFNGTTWVDLGQDQQALTDELKSLVSGLAFTSTEGSYIKGITQDSTTGAVTAQLSNFATDVKTAVGDGAASSTANGITVSVTTTSGSVTGVSVAAANISATSVSAGTGTFDTLVVTDTATFSATTVSASTLTVGGVEVSNIAEASQTDADAGVSVKVTTANGGVTGVDVAVTSATLLTSLALSDFSGKSVVTALGPSTGDGAATDDQVPTALAVAKKLATLDNAMHFKGAGTSLPASAEAGDVYVFTANATDESGYKAGQEVVYTGSAWEVIGDQNTYALNAYAPGDEVVTAGTTTLPSATHAIAAKVDDIATALSDFTYSSVTGGSSSSTLNGVTVDVVTAATTAVPTVTLTGVGTAASMNYSTAVADDSTLPTGAAVTTFVGDQIVAAVSDLDAQVSSSENNSIQVGVTQVDGVVTGVTADLVWLGADGTALS